jgi:hypothetical protein
MLGSNLCLSEGSMRGCGWSRQKAEGWRDLGITWRCYNKGGRGDCGGAITDLQGRSSGGLPPIDHLGHPQVFLLLEPDAIGHPALFPQSKRYFGWLRRWGHVDARWGPTLICLHQDGTMTLSHEREQLGPLRRMAIITYMKGRHSTVLAAAVPEAAYVARLRPSEMSTLGRLPGAKRTRFAH